MNIRFFIFFFMLLGASSITLAQLVTIEPMEGKKDKTSLDFIRLQYKEVYPHIVQSSFTGGKCLLWCGWHTYKKDTIGFDEQGIWIKLPKSARSETDFEVWVYEEEKLVQTTKVWTGGQRTFCLFFTNYSDVVVYRSYLKWDPVNCRLLVFYR